MNDESKSASVAGALERTSLWESVSECTTAEGDALSCNEMMIIAPSAAQAMAIAMGAHPVGEDREWARERARIAYTAWIAPEHVMEVAHRSGNPPRFAPAPPPGAQPLWVRHSSGEWLDTGMVAAETGKIWTITRTNGGTCVEFDNRVAWSRTHSALHLRNDDGARPTGLTLVEDEAEIEDSAVQWPLIVGGYLERTEVTQADARAPPVECIDGTGQVHTLLGHRVSGSGPQGAIEWAMRIERHLTRCSAPGESADKVDWAKAVIVADLVVELNDPTTDVLIDDIASIAMERGGTRIEMLTGTEAELARALAAHGRRAMTMRGHQLVIRPFDETCQ